MFAVCTVLLVFSLVSCLTSSVVYFSRHVGKTIAEEGTKGDRSDRDVSDA